MASVNRRVPTRTNYVLTTTQQPTSTKETSTANTVTGVSTSVPTPTANCKTYTANAPQTKQVTTGTPTNAPAETPSVSTTASAVKTPTSTSSVTTVSTTNAPSTSYPSPSQMYKVVYEDLTFYVSEGLKDELIKLRDLISACYHDYQGLTDKMRNCQKEINKAYSNWKTKYDAYVNSEYRLTPAQTKELADLQRKYEEAVNEGNKWKSARDLVQRLMNNTYDNYMSLIKCIKEINPNRVRPTSTADLPTSTGDVPTSTAYVPTDTVSAVSMTSTPSVPYQPTST